MAKTKLLAGLRTQKNQPDLAAAAGRRVASFRVGEPSPYGNKPTLPGSRTPAPPRTPPVVHGTPAPKRFPSPGGTHTGTPAPRRTLPAPDKITPSTVTDTNIPGSVAKAMAKGRADSAAERKVGTTTKRKRGKFGEPKQDFAEAAARRLRARR